MDDTDVYAKVLGELAQLNRRRRTDFLKVGVDNPVTMGQLASFAAQLSYFIAAAENCDPCRAAVMSLFTMLPNARVDVGDYLSKNFIDIQSVRKNVFEAQFVDMPQKAVISLSEIISESEKRESLTAKCAYEGYRLASAYFDKVYQRQGYVTKSWWIDAAILNVKTKAGMAVLEAINSGDFENWCNHQLGIS